MPFSLDSTLTWKDYAHDPAVAEVLKNLQGNILKGHGRHHAQLVFLRFAPDKANEAKKLLKGLHLTTALEQLLDGEELKKSQGKKKSSVRDNIFRSCLLTFAGYDYLGLDSMAPQNVEFKAGMAGRQSALSDPPSDQWQFELKPSYHVLLIIAAKDTSKLDREVQSVLDQFGTTVAQSFVQVGRAIFNENGHGIEHFGYVDGRSQPLALTEDINIEATTGGGIDQWDPSTHLAQLLVPDPAGRSLKFGSFFVFRKLEQNVKGFKEAEEALAASVFGRETELAGGQLVGRFEDGTPVIWQSDEGSHHPVPNNFNYSGDESGSRCPIFAHIRKTNPRDGSEKVRLMFRRGIPYDEVGRTHPSDRPTQGVGLLFMAYMSNLASQFEFTQQAWANDPSFPASATGLDPIIGQDHPSQPDPRQRDHSFPTEWGGKQRKVANFKNFVTMKGGDYFFAPSLAFFEKLA